MELVVDANILFASLIRDGLTAELLFSKDLQLRAPEFLLEELARYKSLLLEKTRRNDADFDEFIRILGDLIVFVPKEDLGEWLDRARGISPDPGDIPYVALALKLGCGIWSNDSVLKAQKAVPVYSTKDILRLLG